MKRNNLIRLGHIRALQNIGSFTQAPVTIKIDRMKKNEQEQNEKNEKQYLLLLFDRIFWLYNFLKFKK